MNKPITTVVLILNILILLGALSLVSCGGDVTTKGKMVYENEFCDLSEEWEYLQEGLNRKLAVNHSANASVENCQLKLAATLENDQIIRTVMLQAPSLTFTYGYFEARVKFPKQSGLQSACWLTSMTYGDGDNDVTIFGAEIDIEHLSRDSKKIYNTVHYDGYGENHKSVSIKTDAVINEWHTIAIDWKEDSYTFYLDGKVTGIIEEAISHVPQVMNLSLEVSQWSSCSKGLVLAEGLTGIVNPPEPVTFDQIACEGEGIKQAIFPDSFVVDWVRVYQG